MIRAHTVEQVRAAEAVLLAELPDGALMQRAAHGLAYAVLDFLGTAYGRRVVLLVGSGDNGGDALYAGVVLARRGVQVEAWLLSEQAHPGGVAALRAVGGRVHAGPEVSRLASLAPQPPGRVDVVIDGIVGIGGRPGLRPNAVAALAALEGIPVVAVDVPSGVDVDTGAVDGPHVTAALTVTFGTHKACHLVDPAAQACGALELVDIGLGFRGSQARTSTSGWTSVEALQPADVAELLPRPGPASHKYTRGVVGVRAGSATYQGAGLLSVDGAACGLAGMVRYDGDATVLDRIRDRHPEVVGLGRVQAWVVGSGSDSSAEQALRDSLADDVPLVVDADALAFADLARGRPAVLTPHAGELARMLGVERATVEGESLEHARRAAREYDAVVLLKGRHTVIAEPAGRVRVTTSGTPWLATAGAGDVLGGLIGALLAAGLEPFDAASVGSWLHGAAATRASAGGPIVATDVAAAVPDVIAALFASPGPG
ncbi:MULTISPECIES: bifunctional ADP-dependent NAD(P)H-hydrate dehydratase/NAD(P)H-hydrate epimerase [unclassified Nocardioides]|uniref:bifunctional ADP-dependent NAD(P)H-hydrate dehydratase/NAD(P)H-hydrate epimerase n=1 Tax=unclassified Nocardioides TaxID=2615069 RepID=UPI0006FDDAD7|nr:MULTISPECIES: bifunctional ADP-dependent NAD(P)H-hydrate dehydratase/NAD(P)H-hydrate epimerase [unclassified Nocardioides]KRA38383.1 carbohydrate kinase [Nocardioides sp. Root614]KRA92342.1 carbohydrate kinase [Nocardioides sp. Root682]